MTIRELADLLEVSKPTIARAIKELDIKPQKNLNRYELDYESTRKIIKYIKPEQESFDFSDFSERTKKAENIETKINESQQNATENATNQNKSQQIESRLLDMLKEQLAEKDNIIHSQQEQIDLLIKSNTALIAKVTMLEDKKEEPPQEPVIINETREENKKIHWWQRLFS